MSSRDQDAYVLSRVKYVKDEVDDDANEQGQGQGQDRENGGGDGEGASVQQLAREAESLVQRVMSALTALGPGLNPRALHQVRSKMETKPLASDAEAFSWWLADFLPVSGEDKLRFLAIRSTRVRMRETMASITRLTGHLMETAEEREAATAAVGAAAAAEVDEEDEDDDMDEDDNGDDALQSHALDD